MTMSGHLVSFLLTQYRANCLPEAWASHSRIHTLYVPPLVEHNASFAHFVQPPSGGFPRRENRGWVQGGRAGCGGRAKGVRGRSEGGSTEGHDAKWGCPVTRRVRLGLRTATDGGRRGTRSTESGPRSDKHSSRPSVPETSFALSLPQWRAQLV
jgi:hypothetical protein